MRKRTLKRERERRFSPSLTLKTGKNILAVEYFWKMPTKVAAPTSDILVRIMLKGKEEEEEECLTMSVKKKLLGMTILLIHFSDFPFWKTAHTHDLSSS